MKKFLSISLALILCIGIFAGCASDKPAPTDPPKPAWDGTLEELVDAIYTEHPMELMLVTIPIDLTDEYAIPSYTGLENAEGIEEAVASESAFGAQPYSLVIVKVADGVDTAEVARKMHDGIDQRKWVCVEADDLTVSACGNLVMLAMIGSDFADVATSAQLTDAFQTVCGTLTTRID